METAVWRRLYLCTLKKQNELFLPKFDIAVILQQLYYGKFCFVVLVPVNEP